MSSAPSAPQDELRCLLPATLIRGKLCEDARLSKRAAQLLRRECDALGAAILQQAFRDRVERGGPLEPRDLWDAVIRGEHDDAAWLTDRLGLWTADVASLPAEVPRPRPPPQLTPDSDALPPLVWLQVAHQSAPQPLREAFLEPSGTADPPLEAPRPLNSLFLQ